MLYPAELRARPKPNRSTSKWRGKYRAPRIVSSVDARGSITGMTATSTTESAGSSAGSTAAPSSTASRSASSSGGTLASLLQRRASREEIASHLDALPIRERLEQVLAITGKDVGRLYDAVEGAPSLTLEDIAPRGEKGTVILEGRNSLPVVVSRFQKRFAWVGDVLVGYNHQTFSPVTGPGYFVTKPASGQGAHPTELFFDYTVSPPAEPPGWPAYKPNGRGLSRLVYANMIDYCRRVATGVLVGKAYKNGVAQDAYFTLTSAR